ncbi:MAG: ribosome maturation factor RimP [Selenomonadaceae bacterium]|nr:ribosome maturation factor RimP [Selenomonadaceae bacterium]
MAAKGIESSVEAAAEKILDDLDIELVDVEYVKERDWYLRIYIDKEGGINHEDCKIVSEQIEKILDDKDLIKNPYILEVSSPGIDRQLKKAKDFIREMGKTVDVSLYAPIDGIKELTGELSYYDEKEVGIDEKRIPMDKIASVRLHIEY